MALSAPPTEGGLDLTHQTVNQGGNKGLRTYRSDIGIPGYTGFIPTDRNVTLPAKSSVGRTGFGDMSRENEAKAKEVPKQLSRRTMYSTTYEAWQPTSGLRAPGGYWMQKKAMGEGLGGKFKPTTTYMSELSNSRQSAGALSRRTSSIGPSPPPGFATDYGDMVAPKSKHLASTRQGEGEYERQEGQNEAAKSMRDPRRKAWEDMTASQRAHGTYGSDPLAKDPMSERDLKEKASTWDLELGTTKVTHKPPGYGGHVPESPSNKRALSQATGEAARESAKARMLLADIDQHRRGMIPAYGGHQPRAIRNVREQGEPEGRTTFGRMQVEGQSKEPPRSMERRQLSSGAGTDSFFTKPGQISESEQGRAQSQRYYHEVRPLEGAPGMFVPTRITPYGYPYRQ